MDSQSWTKEMNRTGHRYHAVAMALHWITALAILAMIPMGLWMSAAISDSEQQALAYRIFQLHKSVGFTILLLTVLRIAWRLTHRAPAYPLSMAPWERFAASLAQGAFYAVLLAIPLTGWLYVSAGWAVTTDKPLAVATSFFGLFEIPHLGFAAHAAEGARRQMAFGAMGAHEWLVWLTVVLLALHIGAALKHHFINRDAVLSHMMPGMEPKALPQASCAEESERSSLLPYAAAFLLAGLAAIAGWTLNQPEGRQAESQAGQIAAANSIGSDVTPGAARPWAVVPSVSAIRFSGSHAGNDFKGEFTRWTAHIWFDPADLAGSKAVVLVETGSAVTGDATQESTLRDSEWFGTRQFPLARFDSSSIKALGGGRFEMEGQLRVKGASVPVVLPFTFEEKDGTAKVQGKVELDRTALDLGMVSDPTADWVSRMIDVTIDMTATADQ